MANNYPISLPKPLAKSVGEFCVSGPRECQRKIDQRGADWS